MVIYWILILCVVLIIVIIIWGFAIPKPKTVNTNVKQILEPPTKWSTGVSVPGERGTCSVYTFPGKMEGPYAYPGIPRFSALDSLTPGSTYSCVDPDQLVAQKVTKTCKGPENTYCYRDDGSLAKPGETETIYQGCSVPMCTGTLSLIALNYPYQDIRPDCSLPPYQSTCLSVKDKDVILKPCDIGDPTQLFRIDRQTTTGEQNNNGPVSQILYRQTGQCLIPKSDSSGITLGDCSPVWGAISPILSLNGKQITPGTERCKNETQTNCITLSPAQIAYLGKAKLPTDMNSEDLIKYINDSKTLSMAPGPENTVVLTPFSFDLRNGKSKNAQYINYMSYNATNSPCHPKPF